MGCVCCKSETVEEAEPKSVPRRLAEPVESVSNLSGGSQNPEFDPPVAGGPERVEYDKDFKTGVTKFNQKPEKGIEFLIAAKYISATADDIAKFLQTANGLSKTKLGEYLGSNKEANRIILASYINLLHFEGMLLDEALRYFLSGFRLPGEAQIIDRFMEAFATRYCEHNPSVFSSKDTAYVLAFSLIMLNTDAHNPQVRVKMTKEQFVANNRGINSGDDLPDFLLHGMYDRIRSDEIKLNPEGMRYGEVLTFVLPEMEGWLLKQSEKGVVRQWDRRWFAVTGNCLYYFHAPEDANPRCIMPLEDIQVEQSDPDAGIFEIVSSTAGHVLKSAKVSRSGTIAREERRRFMLQAETPEEMKKWIRVLRSEVCRNPFTVLLNRRKQAIAKSSRRSRRETRRRTRAEQKEGERKAKREQKWEAVNTTSDLTPTHTMTATAADDATPKEGRSFLAWDSPGRGGGGASSAAGVGGSVGMHPDDVDDDDPYAEAMLAGDTSEFLGERLSDLPSLTRAHSEEEIATSSLSPKVAETGSSAVNIQHGVDRSPPATPDRSHSFADTRSQGSSGSLTGTTPRGGIPMVTHRRGVSCSDPQVPVPNPSTPPSGSSSNRRRGLSLSNQDGGDVKLEQIIPSLEELSIGMIQAAKHSRAKSEEKFPAVPDVTDVHRQDYKAALPSDRSDGSSSTGDSVSVAVTVS